MRIPREKPSRDSLLAEAAGLGATFTKAPGELAELMADARRVLLTRDDANALRDRGYPLPDATYDRIKLLFDLMMDTRADGDSTSESKRLAQRAETARRRLLKIRERLAMLGAAAALSPMLFSLATKHTTRFMTVANQMEPVILNALAHREAVADRDTVDALAAEAHMLITDCKYVKHRQVMQRAQFNQAARLTRQLARLLFETVQHVSKQGLAAHHGNAMLCVRYHLQSLHEGMRRRRRAHKRTAVAEAVPPLTRSS